MSAGAPSREVAHRLFAVEFDDATVTHTESDEDMAPSYVLTPTGAMVNRAFVVGTLTSVDQVGDDIYRGRVADPTGTFVTYAGQYQPSPANFLAEATPPSIVAVTGKARTFQPDGSDDVLSSLRPEQIVETTPTTRDRWVIETAKHTLGRVELLASVRATGVDPSAIADTLTEADVPRHIARGMQLAVEAYDPSAGYLDAVRQRASQALEVVSGDRESVDPLELATDAESGSVDYSDLTEGGFIEGWLGRSVELEAVETPAEPTTTGSDDEPTPPPEEDPIEEDIEAPTPEDPPEATVGGEAEGMYELSDEEREEVESEFGVDFETGDEVETPEEAPDEPDIEEPEVDDTEVESEPEAETDEADEEESVDVDTAVLEHMRELDDGDGADRHDLVEAVVDATGASQEAVDDAIQDALMSGTCYEPTEDRLKPI